VKQEKKRFTKRKGKEKRKKKNEKRKKKKTKKEKTKEKEPMVVFINVFPSSHWVSFFFFGFISLFFGKLARKGGTFAFSPRF